LKILCWLAAGLAALVLVGAVVYATRTNPIGPIAGRALSGTLVTAPVEDWSFSDAFKTVALETRPAAPHSVTTICFTHGGVLYIPSQGGATKEWTHFAVSDPRVRVKIGDSIYPAHATRVTDPKLLPVLTAAAKEKYHFADQGGAFSLDDVWVFRLDSPGVASAPPPLAQGPGAVRDVMALRARFDALVAAPDRSAEDRARDAARHPVDLLSFARVQPGMRVADLGASSGYTTELLARAVGPDGVVYGQNAPGSIRKYVSKSWPARLAKPVNARVVRIDSSFSDPLPGISDLDLETMVYVYHDLLGSETVERAKMDAALYASLAPGGSLVVVDHRAATGSGEEVGHTLHRIDEQLLRRELLAAGFQLADEADFLANPDDPRDAPFFEREAPTDAFVHRYVKPR